MKLVIRILCYSILIALASFLINDSRQWEKRAYIKQCKADGYNQHLAEKLWNNRHDK